MEIYINRHDERISELLTARRPGRPKEKELLELEEAKRRDGKEWETGFGKFHHFLGPSEFNSHGARYMVSRNATADEVEVPDLTDGPTARLMYSWLESDLDVTASHLDLLRFIRVTKGQREEGVVVSRKGNLDKMGLGAGVEGVGDDWRESEDGPEDRMVDA